MTINLTVGTIAITPDPAATADPVVPQPASEAATYAEFEETVTLSNANHLAPVVFSAYPAVSTINNPASAKVRWPDGYGSTTPPWGKPDDTGPSGTGQQEVQCVGDRWTRFINAAALSRLSFLQKYAEEAVAVATGIKAAIDNTFRTGRVTLTGTTTVVPATFTSGAEIFISRRTDGSAPGSVRVSSVTPGAPGSFTITSSSASDDGQVSYMLVGE